MRARRTWILSEGSLAGPLLGPMNRVLRMACQARLAGTAPAILLERQTEETEYEGIPVKPLDHSSLQPIQAGDAVIASAHLHPRHLTALVKRGIPFDVDLYNLVPYEHMELDHEGYHPFKIFQSRRRAARRYRLLLERAERVYLSNSQQLNFLGGMLFARADARSCRLASRLPERCMLLPMGCSEPASAQERSPYPDSMRSRPIFLWGGGIWSWFDVSTLIEAFRILDQQGSPAALFFLTSHNPSTNRAHDKPAMEAIAASERNGLLDRSIFFARESIGPAELPGYLAHCHAGIMANPARLESFGSWRTRLLDLLPYGKPLVCAGFDPLSHELELTHASLNVAAGDAQGLAEAIGRICQPNTYAMLSEASRQAGIDHSWETLFAPWRGRIGSSDTFITPPTPIPLHEQLAFTLGL